MPRLSNRFPTWAANQTWAVQSFHNYFFEIADEISCENHQQEINTKKICSWGALTEGLEQSPSGVAELRMDVPTLTAEKEEHTTAKTQRKPAGEVWSKTHTASLIFSAKGGKKKKTAECKIFLPAQQRQADGCPQIKGVLFKGPPASSSKFDIQSCSTDQTIPHALRQVGVSTEELHTGECLSGALMDLSL